jgi:hypothetical protein
MIMFVMAMALLMVLRKIVGMRLADDDIGEFEVRIDCIVKMMVRLVRKTYAIKY